MASHEGIGLRLALAVAALALWSLAGAASAVAAVDVMLLQPFPNGVADEHPDISVDSAGGFSRIAWQWWDGADYEIKLARPRRFQGSEILSDNSVADRLPQVDGTLVGWYSEESPGSSRIVVFDDVRGERRPITEPQMGREATLTAFSLTNDRVAWVEFLGSPEIMVWERSSDTTRQITDDDHMDWAPSAAGDLVVWQGYDGSDFEVFAWNAVSAQTTQVTSNDVDDTLPVTDGSAIAWISGEGTAAEIWAWDASDASGAEPQQLTDDAVEDGSLASGRDRFAWASQEGTASEVYAWSPPSGPVLRITENSVWDGEPSVGGSIIAWQQRPSDGVDQVWGWDALTSEAFPMPVPDGPHVLPSADEREIVWAGVNVGPDSDIYWAEVGEPPPPPVDTTPPVATDDAVATYTATAAVSIEATDGPGGSGVVSISYCLDGEATVTVAGASTTVTTSEIGIHELVYTAADSAGNVSEPVTRSFTVVEEQQPPVQAVPERLAGDDRFATSVESARTGFDPDGDGSWPAVTDVIIASGDDRAVTDALAAAGLCWTYDAPLLLVGGERVPSEVTKALAEMTTGERAIQLWIVGGDVAVSQEVQDTLEAAASGSGSARRVYGADRYGTAQACAARMFADGYESFEATVPAILIANGADVPSFADALALSPIAAREGAPVLLVQRDRVPEQTAFELTHRNFDRVVIGGGPVAVSEDNAQDIGGLAGMTPERWYGADRYETAAKIASNAEGVGWLSPATMGVAGRIPDALTGGAAVGRVGGVMLFTRPESLPLATREWVVDNGDAVEACWVFGGTQSVSPAVVDELAALLE